MSRNVCRLCNANSTAEFYRNDELTYLQCEVCGLVFLPPEHFVSEPDEKARYSLHRNSPEDQGYRRFLEQLLKPMQDRLTPGSHGLDFGSGPGPTLSLMFSELGYAMTIFDPHFAPDQTALEEQYDFITASEVLEHLREPGKDLDRLWSCLKPGGHLGVMTQLLPERGAFADWRYRNDVTHVAFYSMGTFEWLAGHWKADIVYSDRNVTVIQKRQT